MRHCAPCETSSSAVARPIPRAEPVTIADLPSSTPIAVLLLSRLSWRRRLPERLSKPRGAGSRRGRSGLDDAAEVLRVDRAGLATRERGQRVRRDADAGVPEGRVEDVRAVSRRVHPAGDERLRRGQPQRRPADVLADGVADARAEDVAGGENIGWAT